MTVWKEEKTQQPVWHASRSLPGWIFGSWAVYIEESRSRRRMRRRRSESDWIFECSLHALKERVLPLRLSCCPKKCENYVAKTNSLVKVFLFAGKIVLLEKLYFLSISTFSLSLRNLFLYNRGFCDFRSFFSRAKSRGTKWETRFVLHFKNHSHSLSLSLSLLRSSQERSRSPDCLHMKVRMKKTKNKPGTLVTQQSQKGALAGYEGMSCIRGKGEMIFSLRSMHEQMLKCCQADTLMYCVQVVHSESKYRGDTL